jgi:alpha-D-ribose 1-methylphosphonate 5-triphosphate synthase subunit PhnL
MRKAKGIYSTTMDALRLSGAAKTFTMHLQDGIRLPVVADVNFAVEPGQCIVLAGPSGAGKSSILKMIYGSYRCDQGKILVRHGDALVDIANAQPRQVLHLRRHVIGYVSQFLRVVPRVPALDVVAEALDRSCLAAGRARAADLLRRLNIPERLWSLPPATFSGGEQQRINIARGFLPELPILLLDEPTASLDADNRRAVVDLVAEKKRRGAAIVAIVHDEDVRNAIADRVVDVTRFAVGA